MDFENFHIGAGSLTVGGQDVGHTSPEGITVTYEPEVHLHKSGKYGESPVKASFLGATVTLKIMLAESTLLNIKRAMAGVSGDDNQLGVGGTAGTEIAGAEIILTPYDGTPSWIFHNAVPTGEVEVAYSAEDERILEAEFTALVDEDQNAGSELVSVS